MICSLGMTLPCLWMTKEWLTSAGWVSECRHLRRTGARTHRDIHGHHMQHTHACERTRDVNCAYWYVLLENHTWIYQAVGENSLFPGPPCCGSRMPAKCVRRGGEPGRRGGRSQDGTAAVWAPSLLARLEKLIIEFLSLPSLQLGWKTPWLPAMPFRSDLACK